MAQTSRTRLAIILAAALAVTAIAFPVQFDITY